MTKADSRSKRSSGPSNARGRGSYTPQACIVCRTKKTKCDGTRPVCEACIASGREDECSWSKEATVRKLRTEAHFEAMSKRADALREYANLLESIIERCRREHGGASDTWQSYRQFRPADADGLLPDQIELMEEEMEEDGASEVEKDPAQELCLPTENLKLEEGGLLLHGNTAIFRFAPPDAGMTAPAVSRFPAIAENPDASYVLMVEGIDDSHYNPDFDWSRHLPTTIPLDRREHDKILDLLFKFFTSWCLRIVPALFLRDMYRALSVPRSETPPKTPHYSPMLHNAIVALASAFSDDPRIRDSKARQYFANTAKSYIEAECHKPNLSVVHGLSILASYHSSQGDQTLGYLFFGMSARMSQALGLGVDCSGWVQSRLITEHDRLDRNWAHWTTFSQDVCWSLYVGRDFCVPAPSDFKAIPVPFVDSEFDQMPWCYPSANIPPQPNFLSKTFAASCELLMIARRIMDVVNGLNNSSGRHVVNDELITDIDLKLNTWKGSLSQDVDLTLKSRSTATPHRIMMHLAYWWLFILLHRPFYHRKTKPIHSSDKDIDHVKLCKRAADNIMELLAAWRNLYPLRYAPITLIQTLFSAGTVHLLTAVQATSGMRVAQKDLKHGLDQAQLCIQYLYEIGKSWQCATNIAEILKNLMHSQLKPLLEHRTGRSQISRIGERGTEPASGKLRKRSSSSQARKERQLSKTRRPGERSLSAASLKGTHPMAELNAKQPQNSQELLSSPSARSSSSTNISGDWVSKGTSGAPRNPTSTQSSGPSFSFSVPQPIQTAQHHLQPFYQPVHPPSSLNDAVQAPGTMPSFMYTGSEFFLAMPDGQTLPDAHFMPPFSIGAPMDSDTGLNLGTGPGIGTCSNPEVGSSSRVNSNTPANMNTIGAPAFSIHELGNDFLGLENYGQMLSTVAGYDAISDVSTTVQTGLEDTDIEMDYETLAELWNQHFS